MKRKIITIDQEKCNGCEACIPNCPEGAIQMIDDKKTEKADKLIDEAADFQDEILGRINAAKVKADFKSIKEDIEKKAIDFVTKLNALN